MRDGFVMDPLAARLFSEAQDGIAIFDEAGSLIAWNSAARAITGWDLGTANQHDLLSRSAGMVELRDGKWVDLRRAALSVDGRDLRLVLFADASAQVALARAQRDMRDGGLIDAVSRLPGPQIALGHLERSLALARRDSRAVGAVSIGIEVPEVVESVTLDELMGQLGKRAIASTRTSDLAARLSARELLVVLTAMAQPNDAGIVAVRLLLALSRPFVLSGRERSVTVSIGVASFPAAGDSADALISAARAAMERKRASGGGYEVAQ